LAQELVHDARVDGQAFCARATTRATFHRFTGASDDLDLGERYDMQLSAVDGVGATIFQTTGRYNEALTIRRKAAECRVGFETLGVLAGQLESAATMDGEHYDQP
jgi:hypothetical protein